MSCSAVPWHSGGPSLDIAEGDLKGTEGMTSHQIDIVIYDNWFTPFIFSQNGFHYIPAEGVYAVFWG